MLGHGFPLLVVGQPVLRSKIPHRWRTRNSRQGKSKRQDACRLGLGTKRPDSRATLTEGARAEQVVTGAVREERAAPGGVVAGVGYVLAGNPDRGAIDRRCAVVTPARADRV